MSGSDSHDQWRRLAAWTSPDNLTRWLERTTWWARPQALKTQQEMLVELFEAIAGRFLGRELLLDVRGHEVRLTLGQVSVVVDDKDGRDPFTWLMDLPASREMRRWTRAFTGGDDDVPAPIERVHVEASNVTVGGNFVGDLTATVETVRLDYGLPSHLVTGPVDIELTTNVAVATDWATRTWPEWTVRRRDAGLVAVRHRDWRFMLLTRPRGLDGQTLRVDVVGVVVFGRDVKFPRRFVRQRTLDLPTPSDELELLGARIDGEVIRVDLRHEGIRQVVRPEHIRAAVREGVASLGAKVFV